MNEMKITVWFKFKIYICLFFVRHICCFLLHMSYVIPLLSNVTSAVNHSIVHLFYVFSKSLLRLLLHSLLSTACIIHLFHSTSISKCFSFAYFQFHSNICSFYHCLHLSSNFLFNLISMYVTSVSSLSHQTHSYFFIFIPNIDVFMDIDTFMNINKIPLDKIPLSFTNLVCFLSSSSHFE